MLMSTRWWSVALLAAAMTGMAGSVTAEIVCASDEQQQQVRAYYATSPGVVPSIASRRLGLPEALLISALPAEQAVMTSGAAFYEVWAEMADWEQATFMIMKGLNVFEIVSPIGAGAPSQTSQYWNIEYVHPVRGHLRPDLYAGVAAVVLPREADGVTLRGVLVFDDAGDLVFGAFISGDGPPPPDSEIAKFDRVMAMIREKPALCRGS